jgi:hypothetical protein
LLSEGPIRSSGSTIELKGLGKDRAATLLAMGAPHHRFAAKLGPHKIRCSSTLSTKASNSPERKVEQQVSLSASAKGCFSAVKHTHPQYGQEVIWTGDWLYLRLRHSKYIRRRPRQGEPGSIMDRMVGYLPAYVELLGPFITVEEAGRKSHEGRDAVRVKLKLNSRPSPPGSSRSPARRWRETIAAKAIKGDLLLDAQTGAPLQARLAASWTFNLPASGSMPASGITERVDRSQVGTMKLTFEQRVSEIGKDVTIERPPDEKIESTLRQRLEIERQILTGERPFPSSSRRKR